MGKLDGAVALVTGGSRGQGAAHVRALVAEGAKVVIGDVLENEGRALAASLGGDASFIQLDVTSDQAWKDAVAHAESTYGPIRILVNNAGIYQPKPWLETTTEDWMRTININMTGQFIGIREVVPSMRKISGDRVIINISSAAGMMGMPGIVLYGASKWGIRGMTKIAALEFAQYGIRVVSVHPGFINTDMTKNLDDAGPSTMAIPRAAEPEEVTELVMYLTTATFCTGSEWLPDGGMVLGPALALPDHD
jgi:3alpha(or 20beta)-hydroxysteroid dehydrogenase